MSPEPIPSRGRLRARLAERAAAAGFDACGVTRPESVRGAGVRLRAAIVRGEHGAMTWMATRLAERADPRALWPAVRSVVMLGESYGPDDDPLAILSRRDRGAISVYARNRDYHDVVKARLKRLGRGLLEDAAAEGFVGEIKVFVDTAPVMEKPLAQAAGLGWLGKHTNMVSRRHGSWLFLGAIFTTLDLEEDAPETDHCGACRRCLDICPTAAFPAPYRLDARRCIAYLTIEHAGHIPLEFRAPIGNRVYGCDDCLAVCPWNKFAETAREAAYWARVELRAPRLADLAALDDAGFRAVFSGSPIKRVGRDRFVRNVLIAIGNSADAALAEAALGRLDDASPLVRAAAAWALSRLDPARFAAEALARRAAEPDPEVAKEWRSARE